MNAHVIPFEQLGMHDVETVGGKNASLGEMIGRTPSCSNARSMRRTASCALSTLDTNGRVTGRNSRPSNCVMRLWPSVSAVTPVWSDTKNAVRRLMSPKCFTARAT